MPEDKAALTQAQSKKILAAVVGEVRRTAGVPEEDVHVVIITLTYKGNDKSGMTEAYTELHRTIPDDRMTLNVLETVAAVFRDGRMGVEP